MFNTLFNIPVTSKIGKTQFSNCDFLCSPFLLISFQIASDTWLLDTGNKLSNNVLSVFMRKL